MSSQLDRVRAYYRSTNFDYEHFWSGEALALHFGYYDADALTHQRSLIRMNEVLADLAGIKQGSDVLDAGCGYGGSSIWLAVERNCRVTGLTVVPHQVQTARTAAAKTPAAERLTFLEKDYLNSGLPDESFDVVWGLESIVHCTDKPAFVKEAFRLLKPGGRLLISEYLLREGEFDQAERQQIGLFTEGWMMPGILTPSAYRNAYEAAGFEKIRIHDLSDAVEPSLKLCRRNAALAMPFVGPLRRLRLIDQIRRDYTVANYVLYDLFKKGLWRYQVVVGTKPYSR